MSDRVRYIDIKAFRKAGYLQEANRRFFHPLGLALEVTIVHEGGDDGMRQRVRTALESYAGGVNRERDDFGDPGTPFLARAIDEMTEAVLSELVPVGSARLSGVWDYRDDPEGMVYAEGYEADGEKAARIDREWAEHAEYRERTLGFVVQPVAESGSA